MLERDEILKSFEGKNILVTGGTGMIGRQVVNLLEDTGAHIKIVSLDRLTVSEKCEHVYGDLTNFNFCKKTCKDMDFVFHVAGIGASVKAIKSKLASHFVPLLMMSTNMLEACRLNEVRKTVFVSSVGAYQDAEVFVESDYKIDSTPMDFAGWAKRMAEAQVYAYKVEYGLDNIAIVRPPNVYGPGDNFHPENSLVIPSLMYRIHNGDDPLIVWGDGSSVRDFVYARDIAEGIILALHYGTDPGFVNLGSGNPCTIKELVETFHSFLDFEHVFDASKPQGVRKRIMDLSLAREKIHFDPSTSLKDGLKETWDWFVKNPEEHLKKINYFER